MHVPVLKEELERWLKPCWKKRFIDATLGEGGHAQAFLKYGVYLLAIDRDPELLKKARENLSCFSNKILLGGNFGHLANIASEQGFPPAQGIYFDLGACLWHFKKSGRGFSFRKNEPLNMRYNGVKDPSKVTAEQILNNWSLERIKHIIRKYGEEPRAASIARQIIERRKIKPITTTNELVKIIKEAVGEAYKGSRIHPATKTFQALRIVVNNELDNLREGLRQAEMLLDKEGRMAAISFHSLEDRMVKNFFKDNPRLKVLTPKPVLPTEEERERNPSARSAKLRVAEQTLT